MRRWHKVDRDTYEWRSGDYTLAVITAERPDYGNYAIWNCADLDITRSSLRGAKDAVEHSLTELRI